MKTERWWWLAAFLFLSVVIHILLALHGPGFGLKGGVPSSQEIELTLLPPDNKPKAPAQKPHAPKPKVAARPQPRALPKTAKAQPKAVPKVTPKPTPKVAVKPVADEKPIIPPVSRPVPIIRVAKVTPVIKPAVSRPAPTVTPETPAAQAEPVKTAAVTPHFHSPRTSLTVTNPLAGLAAPDDQPQAAARADTPHLTRTASAHTGLAGGASGGGHGAAHGLPTPTEQPQDSGLPGGMHFPRMASRIGGQSILSVKNPLAEDAVPEEKPGFSQGTGGSPGVTTGHQGGGLNGKLFASLRAGAGSGLGGGTGSGHGAGSGAGTGSGRGTGHGTGAGQSGAGDGDVGDLTYAKGDGYGRMGIGFGSGAGGTGHSPGGSLRLSSRGGGSAFGDVGNLLRGEPPRAPGDGQPGRDGHGLSAEIYEGWPYLTTLVRHRTDASIDFNWGMTIPVAKGVSRIFSMRWTGKIQPKYSELYTFVSQEDDGLKLWIDGQPLISDWRDHHLTTRRASIRLEAGRQYDIRIEYFNGPDHARQNILGHAEAHLRWASPSQPLEIVPESALYQAQ